MGQTADQIEHHIAQTRDTLGSNLQELEQKVKSVTDWRQHFQKNPMTMIGVAFGFGVLLAAMLGGRRGNGHHFVASAPTEDYIAPSHRKHQAFDTLDTIKGAIIGLAAVKLKDYVEEIVPGFGDQFKRAKDEKEKVRRGESFG